MTLDLMFLAKGRTGYTREAVAALVANTDWRLVRRLVIYTDGQPDWREYESWIGMITNAGKAINGNVSFAQLGGPVNAMLDYIGGDPADVFAKIDNDVIVPPGWLTQALTVMEGAPELDLLGIEPPASRTRAPWRATAPAAPEYHEIAYRGRKVLRPRGYAACDAVGGIGLFRSRAWTGRGKMAQHSTYGGFTDWQLAAGQREVVKGWIVPPIKLFLLDRLPCEPWVSLGRKYQEQGLQRPWTMYSETAAQELAAWWLAWRSENV